jgi:hypothetical protein
MKKVNYKLIDPIQTLYKDWISGTPFWMVDGLAKSINRYFVNNLGHFKPAEFLKNAGNHN